MILKIFRTDNRTQVVNLSPSFNKDERNKPLTRKALHIKTEEVARQFAPKVYRSYKLIH